jgi:hypothetical protein
VTATIAKSYGGAEFPPNLATVLSSRLLTSLEPARRILADLFKAAIEAERREAWQAAVANSMTAEVHRISPTTPVADVLEIEPTIARMRERSTLFPLLAVYVDGAARYEPHLFDQRKLVQPWTVDWILGPADVATAFKLLDTARYVSKLLDLVVEAGGHPAYQSGVNVLGEGGCNFGALHVVGHEGPGQARFAGDEDGTPYYAMTIRLESEEHPGALSSLDAYGPFTGADYDLGIGGAPEGVLPGHLYANTDPPYQDP